MKNILSSIIIIQIIVAFFPVYCFGQDREVFGANFFISETVTTKGGYEHVFIGSDGEYIYTRGTKAFINKWDGKTEQVTSMKVPLKTTDYSLKLQDLEEMHVLGNKLIHLFGSNTHSKKQREVFLVEYDKDNLGVKRKNVIATLDHNKGLKPKLVFLRNKADSTQFGVATIASNESNADVRVFLINSDLSIEKEVNFTLYNESSFDVNISNFSVQGKNISFLATQGYSSVERMVFHVFSGLEGSHAELSLKVHNLENEISDFETEIGDDRKLYLSGFYKGYESNKTVGGIFTQTYNLEDGALLDQSLKPFSFGFITSSFPEAAKRKALRKNSKGKPFDPFSYFVRDVFVSTEGSSVMVGECYYERTVTTTDAQGRESSRTYFMNGDIIFVRKNHRGEIVWVKKFKRSFVTTRPNEGGIVLKDLDEDSFSILCSKDGGGLEMVKVDKSSGIAKVETVYSKEEIGKGKSLVMSRWLISNDGDIMLQVARKNAIRVILVDFDD